MAIFEWRKFNFFDLKPEADRGIINNHLGDNVETTTTTYGNGQIVIGDSTGNVHVFKKDWSCVTFKAHDSPVLLSKFCKTNNLLVTVGEDQTEGCCFKVWNLVKSLREGQTPNLLRATKIALQTPTALDVSENGQLMAIGFQGGSVSLYKGDIGRDRTKNCKSLSGGLSSITGLAFKTTGKVTLLYVCTKLDVLVYNIQGRDREVRILLQTDVKDKPSPIRCSALQTSGMRSFLVGRDSAIYCFDSEDMGPCYALDGVKSALECFRTYIVIVLRPTKKAITSQKDCILTVIDIKNKIIVHTSPIDSVAGIFIEFGSCYILTKQREMLVLDEKDLEAKLSLLFKKNLYDIAVRVAKNSEYDSDSLAEIVRTYADHLYAKNDFSGAVDQYIKTIGHLEPSYVILKYLDSRHIDSLTTYLEALHRSGKATADHTTLLLNCFTRLDRVEDAKDFLEQSDPELKYDLDIAIQVCRTATTQVGHALELARRNKRHKHCISILIEDMKQFEEALAYIATLEVTEAEENLKRYGSELMKKCPQQMTTLLKRICGEFRGKPEAGDLFDETPIQGDPENYLHLFVDEPEYRTEFLEHLVKHLPNCSSKLVLDALLENYLEQWSKEAERTDSKESKEAEELSNKIVDFLQKHCKSIDKGQALVLCRLHDYLPGILWVYEEDKLYHLIVRHYLKHGEYNRLLDTCARLGAQNPSLWLQALTGLRDDTNAPPDMLTEILNVIGEHKLQSPLQVLKSLVADGSGPQLRSVRDYFWQVFKHENDYFREEDEAVEKRRQDGQRERVHIENLHALPMEFKGNNCNNCSQPLTIPAIYYLCQHSFHQDCVRAYTETEKDCPVCQVRSAGIVDKLRAQQESRGKHGVFHDELERASEPFEIVAKHFGYGLFNRIVIFDENDLKTTTTPERRMAAAAEKSGGELFKKADVAPSRPPATTVNTNFGSGAEAKMRVAENRSRVIPAPMSEARMRLQEQQQRGNKSITTNAYSSSLEANIDWSVARNRPGQGAVQKVNQPVPVKKQMSPANPISYPKNINPFGEPTNPFGEDDDDDGIIEEKQPKQPATRPEYKKELDPFADDVDEDVSNNNSGVGEDNYDRSLNPFED